MWTLGKRSRKHCRRNSASSTCVGAGCCSSRGESIMPWCCASVSRSSVTAASGSTAAGTGCCRINWNLSASRSTGGSGSGDSTGLSVGATSAAGATADVDNGSETVVNVAVAVAAVVDGGELGANTGDADGGDVGGADSTSDCCCCCCGGDDDLCRWCLGGFGRVMAFGLDDRPRDAPVSSLLVSLSLVDVAAFDGGPFAA